MTVSKVKYAINHRTYHLRRKFHRHFTNEHYQVLITVNASGVRRLFVLNNARNLKVLRVNNPDQRKLQRLHNLLSCHYTDVANRREALQYGRSVTINGIVFCELNFATRTL